MDLTARQVVLATVAVLALSVAAATLPNPTTGGDGAKTPVGEDPISGEDGLVGTDGDGISIGLGGGGFAFRGLCFPFLLSPWFLTGAILALLVVGVVLYRRTDIIATIGAFGLFLTPAILVFLLLTDCRSPPPTEEPVSPLPAYNISFLFEGSTASGSAGSGSIPSTSPTFMLFLGLVAVVVLVVFLRATGDDATGDESPEEQLPEPDVSLSGVGVSAGRAADRIERDATVENEVYRAWREMTDLLELPDPETATPGEFARRATAAGMDSAHVAELTRLFEESRYGGVDPDEEREERAIEILRAIESAYGDHPEGQSTRAASDRTDQEDGDDADA